MGPARPGLGTHLAYVWPHQVTSDSASSPIYSPSRENSRERKEIHGELRRRCYHRTHLGGFWSPSRHPAGGRNHRRRPSSSPCLPPCRCVSSSPRDYGSIAVARWLSSPLFFMSIGLVSCLT